MKVYLISNNLVLDGINYAFDTSIEQKRLTRPLSIEGEKEAKEIAQKIKVEKIYSSNYASALATAKYIADINNTEIIINNRLNDSKIGNMGRHNIKMLRFMQEKNFDFKFESGESLNETMQRLYNIFKNIVNSNNEDIAIITHRRAIMGLLLKFCEKGYNLDDRLILTYNDKVILDDTENEIDKIIIELNDDNIENIDIFD